MVRSIINKLILWSQAVTAMVQQAMQYIDETPDVETRIELIKTLNSVSAGKVSMQYLHSPFCFMIFQCSDIHLI